jgi:CRP-like cAMP-binding protein
MISFWHDTERDDRLREAIDHLRTLPEFADCTEDDFRELFRSGATTNIPSQWAFLQESTPADAAYLLLNGTAKVFRHGVAVATLAVGDVVGEAALVNNSLRTATVASVSTLKALRIDSSRWSALMRRRPNLRRAFEQLAAARLAVSPT